MVGRIPARISISVGKGRLGSPGAQPVGAQVAWHAEILCEYLTISSSLICLLSACWIAWIRSLALCRAGSKIELAEINFFWKFEIFEFSWETSDLHCSIRLWSSFCVWATVSSFASWRSLVMSIWSRFSAWNKESSFATKTAFSSMKPKNVQFAWSQTGKIR